MPTIIGTSGNDTLNGTSGDDLLQGLGGNDSLFGGGGSDTLQGGNDDDLIRGGDDEDLLEGGDGNDNLRGDAGSDTHDGGAGWDFATYVFTTLGSGITFDARLLGATSTWTVADPLGGTDTLISIETLGIGGTNFDDILYGSEYTERPDFFANQISGNGGNDLLIGASHADLINGGTGNDSLQGQGGDDRLQGGAGDDLIRGGDGDDLLEGGDGNDNLRGDAGSDTHDGGAGWDFATYLFTTLGSGITFDARLLGATSTWTVADPLGGTDTLISIETLGIGGTNFDDILYGSEYTERPDFFANQISGNGGNDLLIGASRADFLNGGAGNDTLQGQGGDDRLLGGAGDDTLEGGGGADLFDYTFAVGTMDQDTITDIDSDDVIDLRFNSAIQFIGTAAFTNVAGQYRYQVVGEQTLLQVDTDGNGLADEMLTIANGAFELGETEAGSNILQLVQQNLEGSVSDGYLAGATVFVDVNGNRQHDAGEDSTVTEATGLFTLDTYQVGTLVAIGGTNIDTLIANTITLAAPAGSGVVNPLTTLIQAVVEQSAGDPQPITVLQAQALVLAALGLDPTLDLLNLDLIAAAASNLAAFEAQQAAAMMANLVATTEDADGADGDTEGLLINALADLVTGGGASIDLTDGATLASLLTVALPGVDVSAIATEVGFENGGIAEATSIEEISAAQLDAHVFDHLAGGDGDDLLTGSTGRDRLVGGDGVDFLWGGEGDDLFVAEITPTKIPTKQGILSFDVIFDFTSGDAIDLSGLDANSLMSGNQVFNWKGSNASKSAGDLSFKSYSSVNGAEKAMGIDIDGVSGTSPYPGPVTIVFGNVDGGAADFAIALIGVASVTQSDFVFGDGGTADFAIARMGVGGMTQSDDLLICY